MTSRRWIALAATALLVAFAALAVTRFLRGPVELITAPPLASRLAVARIKILAKFVGRADAQLLLGMAYANGSGVPMDPREAVEWYRKAARQGDASAQLSLGLAYFEGRGVQKDPEEAVRWLTRAAEAGVFNAQYRLADLYSHGNGVPLDAIESVKWWRRMARGGDLQAKRDLAWATTVGWGTDRNQPAAIEMWTELADHHDSQAKYWLGRAYAIGDGVPQDAPRAVQLWLEAAKSGSSTIGVWASLCRAYGHGTGVDADPVEAAKWCRRVLEARSIAEQLPPVDTPFAHTMPSRIRLAEELRQIRDSRAMLEQMLPAIEDRAKDGDPDAQEEFGAATELLSALSGAAAS